MEYKLRKPYVFEDKTYEVLNIDLDSLSGHDLDVVTRQFSTSGRVAAIPAADCEFCALVLARAGKLPLELFKGLPAKDYYALSQQVTAFFLGSDLETETL